MASRYFSITKDSLNSFFHLLSPIFAKSFDLEITPIHHIRHLFGQVVRIF